MQGFPTWGMVNLLVVDDLVDSWDGLKVAKDIGLDITPVEGPAKPVLDIGTMSEAGLSRLGDILVFDFD